MSSISVDVIRFCFIFAQTKILSSSITFIDHHTVIAVFKETVHTQYPPQSCPLEHSGPAHCRLATVRGSSFNWSGLSTFASKGVSLQIDLFSLRFRWKPKKERNKIDVKYWINVGIWRLIRPQCYIWTKSFSGKLLCRIALIKPFDMYVPQKRAHEYISFCSLHCKTLYSARTVMGQNFHNRKTRAKYFGHKIYQTFS